MRVKTRLHASDSILSLEPRSPRASVRQYLCEKQEGMQTASHQVICRTVQGSMNHPLLVSNDLAYIQQQPHSAPLQIASFPSEYCLSYP